MSACRCALVLVLAVCLNTALDNRYYAFALQSHMSAQEALRSCPRLDLGEQPGLCVGTILCERVQTPNHYNMGVTQAPLK
jgi:hypothetical protein